MKRDITDKGMSLLELLIVVLIIGIISTIAVWNYFIAIERAKSKKSVADMRAIGDDGTVDRNYDTTPTDEFDCDIVYSNGVFVIYPEKVD